ncbi:hypothetical protein KQI67_22390 [Bacillus albus]|uniref:hypothetical protein n=1 Tax=Bacillus albus TaxID=2026189 RepID=UPI001C102F60|nr:hypothetical protein [Bacillus albus]MBU5219422.1 hypothetical protein [Bacillus albus]
MNVDIKIISAFISVIVSVLTFLIIHLYIEPKKAKRHFKMERLKNLYAPLYTIVVSRINFVRELGVAQNRILLGNSPNKKYLNREYMEKFILDNSGYASDELIKAFVDYTSSEGSISHEVTVNLVTVIVKEYNKLKKELNIEYDDAELNTGIPNVIKEFREIS